MINARNFGIVTAFALAAAFLADVVIAPALVVLAARSDSKRSRARAGSADPTRSGADVRPVS